MGLARRCRPPLAALTCWILLALFAGGHQPARVLRCACTAAHNCGCSCWSPEGAHDAPVDAAGGGCCARAREDDATCPAGPDDAAVPPGGAGGHHRTARLDWDRSEPLAVTATRVPQPVLSSSRPVRPDWSPDPPERPPRARAAVSA